MEQRDGHMHLDEEEASGGSKENVVRWVLLGGLFLAIVLLSAVWIIPALTQGDIEEEATVGGEISSVEGEQQEGNSTDSIVSDYPGMVAGSEDDETADPETPVETIPN